MPMASARHSDQTGATRSQIIVRTYTDDRRLLDDDIAKLFKELAKQDTKERRSNRQAGKVPETFEQYQYLQDTKYSITGEMQRSSRGNREAEQPEDPGSCSESSGPCYLWICLELTGDGYSTPIIEGIEAHFPRTSYLEYLPTVFSADDESKWFLERYQWVIVHAGYAIDCCGREIWVPQDQVLKLPSLPTTQDMGKPFQHPPEKVLPGPHLICLRYREDLVKFVPSL